jgi:uncharacterized protein YjbJ (UPF0337 family)
VTEDKIKGQWKPLAGKLKAHWSKLTHGGHTMAEGSSAFLAGKRQERYGITIDEAKRPGKRIRTRPISNE